MTTAVADLLQESGMSLARAIRARDISARAVVDAHIAQVERVNPSLNAVVRDRFDAARAEADRADARIAAAGAGEILPPLLGVPCTVKESIGVAGMPNCSGVVARRSFICGTTAPSAQRLFDAGAILLGVTNTSELTLWIESTNRVYGRTSNAYDPRRSAGGSSGGEGSIVGAGGAPIGLGSDMAGSIRIPAFFNGVFGHKSSPGLVPNTGIYPEGGIDTMRLVATGPFARRAEDLAPMLRILAGPDGVDTLARELEVGDPAAVDLDGLGVVVPERAWLGHVSRELLAARDRAAGALAAAGAELSAPPMRSLRRAFEYFLAALSSGVEVSTRDILIAAGADDPRFRAAVRRGGPHTLATWLLLFSEALSKVTPDRLTRRQLAAGKTLADEVTAVIGDGVMLFPPHRGVAPRHNGTVGRPWTIAPTALFNLTGHPVTQVPLGLGHAGLPLGVQVAAADGNDHVAIAVALELERVFGGWVAPA